MTRKKLVRLFIILTLLVTGSFAFTGTQPGDDLFISYQVDLKKQDLKLYWKDDKGRIFKSIKNLKDWLESKQQKLVFAMNGGMYTTDNAALGLFIQDGKTIASLNKRSAGGNFYLKPNGVFYIDAGNNPVICSTEKFTNNGKVKYATQSGPMLLIDGKIHPAFDKSSKNLNIRNGVGVLPDNKVVFVMSKWFVNFYDFANYFKKLGCKNALYLDGAISQTYLPEKEWAQTGGNFGVIIGVATKR